ncbi:hypothetical protein CK203_112380 [Vitis vinifera]|uniref:Uncharacterized protein n=1 Tax=Vitis vinifera TaxID=29760 RepID=A0A438C8W8_VITVI|nr:hypothetical protein CK203_112380 [Vitis vinifera]
MNYRMKLCAFSFFLLLLFQKSPAQNATLDPSEGGVSFKLYSFISSAIPASFAFRLN